MSTIAIAQRLFVALDLPDEVRQQLSQLAESLAQEYDGRVVPVENLHVTLAFLGAIAEEEVDEVRDRVHGALVSSVITTHFTRIVARPRPASAQLLAMELADSNSAIARLAQQVHQATDIVASSRPARGETFWPHITLVRLRHPTRVRRFPPIGNEHVFDISRASLYDSLISPGRPPRYEALDSATLGTLA